MPFRSVERETHSFELEFEDPVRTAAEITQNLSRLFDLNTTGLLWQVTAFSGSRVAAADSFLQVDVNGSALIQWLSNECRRATRIHVTISFPRPVPEEEPIRMVSRPNSRPKPAPRPPVKVLPTRFDRDPLV